MNNGKKKVRMLISESQLQVLIDKIKTKLKND
jgi:hypothetical protein